MIDDKTNTIFFGGVTFGGAQHNATDGAFDALKQ